MALRHTLRPSVSVSGQAEPGISGPQGPRPGRLSPDGGAGAPVPIPWASTAVSASDPGQPPTSNTGVVNGDARSDPYAWDWSATTHENRDGIVADLLAALGAEVVTVGKGLQGWSQSAVAFDAGGYKVGAVYFGGGRDDVHVLATGSQAQDARAAVVGLGGVRTARVDTRADTLVGWSELVGVARGVAGRKARITSIESEQDGRSLGRTVYVGAPSSAVRIRIYEKWLQAEPGTYVEGTNRVEVQLRPPSRAKAAVSAWTAAETFCASELARRMASELGTELAHPATLQKQRETPDLQRTLRAMGVQYGPSVDRFLQVSGGDLDTVVGRLLSNGLDSEPDHSVGRPGSADLWARTLNS